MGKHDPVGVFVLGPQKVGARGTNDVSFRCVHVHTKRATCADITRFAHVIPAKVASDPDVYIIESVSKRLDENTDFC